jgi:hypothetical protein
MDLSKARFKEELLVNQNRILHSTGINKIAEQLYLINILIVGFESIQKWMAINHTIIS